MAKIGINVELGTELISFEQTPDKVSVKLSKSNEAGESIEEVSDFKWLIGCDGARSTVRHQLNLSFLGESRQAENFVIGDIYIKDLENKLDRNVRALLLV